MNFFQRLFDKVDLKTLGIALFLFLTATGLTILFLRLRLPARGKEIRNSSWNAVRQQVMSGDREQRSPSGGLQAKTETEANTPARLTSIQDADGILPAGQVFNLPPQETLLGSDKTRCQIVLTGPTIAPVHAKIFVDNAQNYYLADHGSVAGTWVNYTPVSSQGTRLFHGNVINIGGCSFRFELTEPQNRPIQVNPYSEE